MLLQNLVNGLLLGGLYGIAGIGFSLVWGVMGVINVAHGSLIMIGAYITFWFFQLYQVDPFLSIPISMGILFVLGYLLQRYVINLVIKAGMLMTLILTFGLDMFFVNMALLLWSSDYRSVTPAYAGAGFQLGSLIVPYIRLAIFAMALAIAGLLYLYLTYTKTGNAIRATALNKEAAQLVGVNINRTYALTFSIGAALAGAAGSLVSTVYTISPVLGSAFLTKAFVITVLGGLGSMAGAILAGIILGLAENLGAAFIGPGYQEAIGFIILVIILVLKPQGLLGKRFYGEAK